LVKSKCQVSTFCESTCRPLKNSQRFLLFMCIFSLFSTNNTFHSLNLFLFFSSQKYPLIWNCYTRIRSCSIIFTPRTTSLRYVALFSSLICNFFQFICVDVLCVVLEFPKLYVALIFFLLCNFNNFSYLFALSNIVRPCWLIKTENLVSTLKISPLYIFLDFFLLRSWKLRGGFDRLILKSHWSNLGLANFHKNCIIVLWVTSVVFWRSSAGF